MEKKKTDPQDNSDKLGKLGVEVIGQTIVSPLNNNLNFLTQRENEIFSNPYNKFDLPLRSLFTKSAENQLKLQQEINTTKIEFRNLLQDFQNARDDKERLAKDLEVLNEKLQTKEKINHILPRICEEARDLVFSDLNFRDNFEDSRNCESVVLAIDIRRSTELMLKARNPELFSKFITELSHKLREIIINNFGVFDKFTGDGILAFFPKFYSGEFAIVLAIKAAQLCHEVFDEHYKNSKECFNVFLKDIGLGIGIDFGHVTLVNTINELTVVGIPVVYACRMAGAKAGETLLNQPAKEEIARIWSNYIKISETELNIKNEGTALAYKIEINASSYVIPEPEWYKEFGSSGKIEK